MSRPPGRAPLSRQLVADLASRLTGRDHWLIAMLAEHPVLTTPQIRRLAFPDDRSTQLRLATLYRLQVLDRFRPFHDLRAGSRPYHWVLGPAGAAALAARRGRTPAQIGYRRERALAVAHSRQLAHTVGVADVFVALAAPTHHGLRDLTVWWSERRCATVWGDLVRPDGYGRLTTTGATTVEFFLEYDTGSETLDRVAGKLGGYRQLAAASGLTTPLLIWTSTSRREHHLRDVLALRTPDNPMLVPIATAAGHPPRPDHPVWLPLHKPGARLTLGGLAARLMPPHLDRSPAAGGEPPATGTDDEAPPPRPSTRQP